MRRVVTGARVLSILAVVFFGSITTVQSQDVFQEIDQIKQDLSNLKNEVKELRNQVLSLKSGSPRAEPLQQGAETATPKEEPAAKPEPTLTDEQLTTIICQAVGTFFSESDAILGSSDRYAADDRMRESLRKLNASLRRYTGTHRVSKLLGIYEGLASDAYMAVELRDSIGGNQDFLRALRKHREKYQKACRGR